MNRRNLLQTSSAGALLVIGIAAMLNVLSHFVHLRLDLSQGRVYSVSPATKKLLRSLPDPVLVKVYHSHELPPQIATSKAYARDLLEEYRTAAGGKVRVKFVDTDADPKAKEDATRDGVAPVRFDIFAQDRFEQREGFLGLSLQYRDKKETIPFLQDIAGLEYDLTSRIKTLTLPAKPVLAFITSHRAMGPDALDPALREKLDARYQVRALDLATVSDDGIAPDIQTALLLGPEEKLSDRELWLLDQFLLSGRSLGVAIDTKRVDMRGFYASANETGLQAFLAKHGVKVLSTIVLDQQSQPIQISMQQGFFAITNVVQYPPFVVSNALSPEHPVTKGLDSIVVPFGSPLELAIEDKAVHGEILAKSSKYSWAKPEKTATIILHPFQLRAMAPGDLKGPFGLAAAVDGDFSPFFAQPPKGVKAKAPLTHAARPGRLGVVGTSKVLAQSFRVPPSDNVFMLNLMDWLSLDAELIAIRNKTVAFRPLHEIPPGGKALVRYALIFGPPLLVVAAGLLRWRLRRRQRSHRVAQYGMAPAPARGPSDAGVPPPAAPSAGRSVEPTAASNA